MLTWLSYRNDLSYFRSTDYPNIQPSVESIGLSVHEKKRKTGRHLGFPIETFVAIFNLQIVSLYPAKFRVIWPFGSVERAQDIFSNSWARRHLGFLIETLLGTIQLQAVPILCTKCRVNWSFGSGQEAQNRF